nr:hypothetical protein [Rhodococcus sp. 06-621-2]
MTRRAARYQAIAARLPTEGATAALFGRRDAVLLLLAGAGLSHTAISEIDRSDVSVDGESLWIGGRHGVRIDPHTVAGCRPVEVWERWRTALQFSDRYPSTPLLAEHLQHGTFPDMNALPDRPGPVAVPIDRWGHLPLSLHAMTTAEIGAVIAAHRTGLAPPHAPVRRTRAAPKVTDHQPNNALTEVSSELDSGYYGTGVGARRRAHKALPMCPTSSTTSKTASSNCCVAPSTYSAKRCNGQVFTEDENERPGRVIASERPGYSGMSRPTYSTKDDAAVVV